MAIVEQTPEQKIKSLQDAGLTSSQQQGVLGGTGYSITSDTLKPQESIVVPPKPTDTTNYQGTIAGGQATIDAQNKAIQKAVDDALAKQTTQSPDWLKQFMESSSAPASVGGAYESSYAQSGLDTIGQTGLDAQKTLKTAQSKLGGITAQLAGLTAEAQAFPIQVQQESIGRGVTKAGVAPIETARLRDIALRALPLQAQALSAQAEVQSAQGDVELAQNTLALAQQKFDTAFQYKSQDIQNEYTYKKDLRDKIYDYLTTSEKNTLASRQKEDDRKYQEKRDAINNAQAIAKTATENGQADIAAQITALDNNSATYNEDVALLQSQIKQKADLQFVSGTDNQPAGYFNKTTGRFTPIGGAGTKAPEVSKGKEQVGLVLNSLKNAESLAKASGRSGARRAFESWFVGSTDYTNLVAETNTLRTNVLTMMTDPAIKKFFGPQMSNADVQLMTSAGTTLNPELQNPQKMKEELGRLKDLTQRAKMSLDGVTQFGLINGKIRVGMTPDGKIIDAEGNEYDTNGKKK